MQIKVKFVPDIFGQFHPFYAEFNSLEESIHALDKYKLHFCSGYKEYDKYLANEKYDYVFACSPRKKKETELQNSYYQSIGYKNSPSPNKKEQLFRYD